jgi:hypothetical protein
LFQKRRKNNLNATFRNLDPFLDVPYPSLSRANGTQLLAPSPSPLADQLFAKTPLMKSASRQGGIRLKSVSETTIGVAGGGGCRRSGKQATKPHIRIDSCADVDQ